MKGEWGILALTVLGVGVLCLFAYGFGRVLDWLIDAEIRDHMRRDKS